MYRTYKCPRGVVVSHLAERLWLRSGKIADATPAAGIFFCCSISHVFRWASWFTEFVSRSFHHRVCRHTWSLGYVTGTLSLIALACALKQSILKYVNNFTLILFFGSGFKLRAPEPCIHSLLQCCMGYHS
jgi:hypothetical protein